MKLVHAVQDFPNIFTTPPPDHAKALFMVDVEEIQTDLTPRVNARLHVMPHIIKLSQVMIGAAGELMVMMHQ